MGKGLGGVISFFVTVSYEIGYGVDGVIICDCICYNIDSGKQVT